MLKAKPRLEIEAWHWSVPANKKVIYAGASVAHEVIWLRPDLTEAYHTTKCQGRCLPPLFLKFDETGL